MGILAGQVALVTGAAQGLGEAFARRLRTEGCEVILTDRQPVVLDVAQSLGARAHVGDVADAAHVRAVVDHCLKDHGGVDILINNAGEVKGTGPRDAWEDADADYERLFGSNTKGAFLFGRAVAPIMIQRGGGNIVNVSTDHVKPCPDCHRHHGHGYMDLYNAAKWALNGFTFDWAIALGKHNIRVNNLCMGATDTAMLRNWLGTEPEPEVLAKWMRPDQIAQILVELLEEGPDGRTANSIGLYAGYPCEMPPAE